MTNTGMWTYRGFDIERMSENKFYVFKDKSQYTLQDDDYWHSLDDAQSAIDRYLRIQSAKNNTARPQHR